MILNPPQKLLMLLLKRPLSTGSVHVLQGAICTRRLLLFNGYYLWSLVGTSRCDLLGLLDTIYTQDRTLSELQMT